MSAPRLSRISLLAVYALAGGSLVVTEPDRAAGMKPRNGQIAFVDVVPSGTDVTGTLYTVSPAGGRTTERSTYGVSGPAWSPDGRRLAVVTKGAGVVVRDPWDRRRGKRVAPEGEHPTWSPTGGRLAYARSEGADARRSGVYVVNATGQNAHRIGTGTTPAWSSTNRIAFTLGREPASLYTMRPDGSGRRRVVRDATDPTWSPDGRRLAFVRASEVIIVGAHGGTVRRVAGGNDPVWSPDGTHIAFTDSQDGFCNDSLWTIRVDGTQKRQLRLSGADCVYDLAWQPALG